MPVPVVQIRAVRVFVLHSVVSVSMAVLADDRRYVSVLVMPIVVTMRVLVLGGLVLVSMQVHLRYVKVDRDREEQTRGHDEFGAPSIAKPIGQSRAHERTNREERPGSRGPERTLRTKVQAKAYPISERTRSGEREAPYPPRPWFAKNYCDHRRKDGARDRFAQDDRVRIEVRKRPRQCAVERPRERSPNDRGEAEPARAAARATAKAEQHGACHHQSHGESHSGAAWLTIERSGEQDGEDRF